ncbi:MAG: hypothetical protein LBR23_07785 [Spirochaetaceae bacterium]|jgi:hypothetical protein|nr:hypothetical protein [Spirochaetaceae bacterium]
MTNTQKSAVVNSFFYAFSLGCALLFAVLLWNDVYRRFTENTRAPIGWILRTGRVVQRQLARRTIWERAVAELSLYPGDKIRTGDDSAVRISLASGDVIDLGSNSIITIEITGENTGAITLEAGVVVPVVSTGGVVVRTIDGKTAPLGEEPLYAAGEPPGESPVETGGAQPEAVPGMPQSVFQELDVVEETEPLLEVTSLLPRPENLRPQGVIGREELAEAQGVVFSWDPVPGAERYELTLRTPEGVLLRSELVPSTARYVSDLALFLSYRSLFWSVQAHGEGEIRSAVATGILDIYLPPIEAPEPGLPERR